MTNIDVPLRIFPEFTFIIRLKCSLESEINPKVESVKYLKMFLKRGKLFT